MHQLCSPQVSSWDKFTCSNSFEPSFDNNSKLFELPTPILQCSIYIVHNFSYRLIKSKFSLGYMVVVLVVVLFFWRQQEPLGSAARLSENLGQLLLLVVFVVVGINTFDLAWMSFRRSQNPFQANLQDLPKAMSRGTLEKPMSERTEKR